MPHPSSDGQPDPDTEQIILGVDTHKDVLVRARRGSPPSGHAVSVPACTDVLDQVARRFLHRAGARGSSR
jgi:hypothetical protein